MRDSTPQIGYIVKMFPRLSETFIRNEILELERQGLSLRIFSLKRPVETDLSAGKIRAEIVYLPERVFREPFRVFRAHAGTFWRYPGGYLSTLLHVLRGREFRSLGRGLRRFSQTCCLVHELGGVRHLHAHFANDPTRLASWAQRICKISFSVTTHAKDLYQENRISSAGLHYKLNFARFVVANSQFSAEGIRAANRVASPKVFTIYNGIDLSDFPLRSGEPKVPVILSVGRLIEKKGFENLLLACRKLKDWEVSFHCEIIGSGPLKQSLTDLIARLELSQAVHLRGQMPHSEIRECYRQAMVFALPCVVAKNGDRDILPNVLKEAMAVGLPVVTTRMGGIEELVTDAESGLIVSPGDAEELARALQRLLGEPSLRRRLAAQGRKVIEERFDLSKNFALLRNLLREIVGPATDSSALTRSGARHLRSELAKGPAYVAGDPAALEELGITK